MQSTRILAIRHGETPWNVEARIQGQLDIHLNDNGRWQALRAGQALASEPVAAVYSSDLGRAHETAACIARAVGLEVLPHAGLRERRFGMFEGRTFQEVEQSWPEQARNWRQRLPHWRPPEDGETLLELRERVAGTLAELAGRHSGEQIVLVSHGGVLDTLYRIATGQDISSKRTWELPNASINRLLWTPQSLTMLGWCDTRHLEDHAPADETSSF